VSLKKPPKLQYAIMESAFTKKRRRLGREEEEEDWDEDEEEEEDEDCSQDEIMFGGNIIPEIRTILITGPITVDLANSVYKSTHRLLIQGNGPILYSINTSGGEIEMGALPLLDIIRLARTQTTIYTYCYGAAYSAGALLLAAGDVGHRYISPQSRALIHDIQVRGGVDIDMTKSFSGEIQEWQMASDMVFKNLVAEIGKKRNKAGLYSPPTKRESEKIQRKIKKWYQNSFQILSANDAVELGLADEVTFFMPMTPEMLDRRETEGDLEE